MKAVRVHRYGEVRIPTIDAVQAIDNLDAGEPTGRGILIPPAGGRTP